MAAETYENGKFFGLGDLYPQERYADFQGAMAAYNNIPGGTKLMRVIGALQQETNKPDAQMDLQRLNKLTGYLQKRDFDVRIEPLGEGVVQVFINNKPLPRRLHVNDEAYASIGGSLEAVATEPAPVRVAPAPEVNSQVPKAPQVAAVIVGVTAAPAGNAKPYTAQDFTNLIARAAQSGNAEAAILVEGFIASKNNKLVTHDKKISGGEESLAMMLAISNDSTAQGKQENASLAAKLDELLPPLATPNAAKKSVTAAKG